MGTITQSTAYQHIICDESGIPFIAGTTMKVVELVMGTIAYGWSAEELHFQYPFLSLGQIHSALAYYWDHREELDNDIERRMQLVDSVLRKTNNEWLRKKLREKGISGCL